MKHILLTEGERQGIVLRMHAPYRHSVAIFDSKLGRINAIFSSPKLFASLLQGGLICYKLEQWRDRYRITDVELVCMPHDWVVGDILFLHHVLEMALSFIPEHSRCHELFELCMTLYVNSNTEATSQSHFVKKLFLAKFFALLGVYPDDALSKEHFDLFELFSSGQYDETVLEETDELHKKLQNWLIDCIQTHPHANTFNTVGFVRSLS